MKINIEWQDQFGHWRHYQTKHHQPSAYRTALQQALSTEKRHRLVYKSGKLLDLLNP